jgi:hypothetical protein
MRLVTHQKLVNRNVALGKYTFYLGMALLLGAFAINLYAFTRPDDPQIIMYAFAAFLVGFTLTNISTILNNRWGRRPDRGLAEALKGLDDRYVLYNYRLGAAHVLVGPSGAIVLVPKYQAGAVAYADGKWKHLGARRGLFSGFFARDPLGNPSAEAAGEVEALNAFLKKHLPDQGLAPRALIVFMHPRAEVSAKDAPVPALHVKQLKETVRRLPKGPTLSAQALTGLEEKLGLTPPRNTKPAADNG